MQDNLRFFLWIVVTLLVAWFTTMTVSRNLFFNYNADSLVSGTVAIQNTDIGNQCGAPSSNELIDYKLTRDGKIIYLCPLGFWPIQKRIVAINLTDNFRKNLPTPFLSKISVYYPEPQKVEPLIPLPMTP